MPGLNRAGGTIKFTTCAERQISTKSTSVDGPLSDRAAPSTDVSADRIQNECGFDGGRGTTGAGSLENAQEGRRANNLLSAGRADNAIFLDQKIGIVTGRALASKSSKGSVKRRGQQRGRLRR